MPTIKVPGFAAVTYEELTPDSPTISLAKGQHRMERKFRVRWIDVDNFTKAVLGFPYVVQCPLNNIPYDFYIRRALPMLSKMISIPTPRTDEGKFFLYASQIARIEPKGARGYLDVEFEMPVYEWAIITVVFESQIYNFVEDGMMPSLSEGVTGNTPVIDEYTEMTRYITKTRRPSADYVTIPRQSMKWVAEGDGIAVTSDPLVEFARPMPVDYATSMLIPSMELQYVWHEVPFIPAAARKCIGHVNRFRVGDGHDVYEPGTLLLLSADIKPYRHQSGQFVWDITYRVKQFEPELGKGHNYFLRWLGSTKKLTRRRLTSTGFWKFSRGAGLVGGTTNPGRSVYPSVDYTFLFTKTMPDDALLNQEQF